MKKHQVNYVIIFLLAALVFTGCGKDTEPSGTSVNTAAASSSTGVSSVVSTKTPVTATTTPTPTPTPTPTSAPEPTVTSAPEEASVVVPVVITGLDKKAEYVSIKNVSDKDIDLTGWYILSVTGEQKYKFPDGYIIKAGAEIKVVSYQATGDLVWTTGNMWNNSKSDPAELYNAKGILQSRWDD